MQVISGKARVLSQAPNNLRDPRHSRFPFWLTLAVSLVVLGVLTAPAANEEQLKSIWDAHQASPQSHAEIKAACEKFAKASPADPLLPVVHGILAWHLFQEGAPLDAERLLKSYLGSTGADPVTGAAHRIACGWMTRLSYGRVAQALQVYYRKKVAYPSALAELATFPDLREGERPPLQDAFGTPWKYRLSGFKDLPGFENQRYSLQSELLGASSELSAALKLPYASGINVAIERVADETPPKVVARSGTQAGLLVPGQSMGGISLAFVGRKMIVLANHSYWKVYPRP